MISKDIRWTISIRRYIYCTSMGVKLNLTTKFQIPLYNMLGGEGTNTIEVLFHGWRESLLLKSSTRSISISFDTVNCLFSSSPPGHLRQIVNSLNPKDWELYSRNGGSPKQNSLFKITGQVNRGTAGLTELRTLCKLLELCNLHSR